MDSPLARVILATLGGYLMVLLVLCLYNWFVEEYPRRPAESTNSERIQHPFHHQKAVSALKRFSGLPEPEKAALMENLKSNLISMEQWIERLEESNFQILCMGELHEESTRSFLAEEFFAKVSADVLLLEATPQKLNQLIRRMEAGRDYYPLLHADIMTILRCVKDRNPDIRIYGIEETGKQAKSMQAQANSRDQTIARNFWVTFEPGYRHIILFGALHCTNESNWLFHNLCSQASAALREKMINVQVLGEHQNGRLKAFVSFLDEIALEKRHFVISDTRWLHPLVYEWFPLFNEHTLKKYRSLIVFRP